MLGREAFLQKGGATIAGVRTKTISWGGTAVNLTSGEDNGIQLLADLSGEENISISFDGIEKSNVIRAIALGSGSKMLTDITMVFPATDTMPAATLACDFKLTTYEMGLPYNDGITFSASMESSGAWVYEESTE